MCVISLTPLLTAHFLRSGTRCDTSPAIGEKSNARPAKAGKIEMLTNYFF
jgi:hypothetical protein